MGLGKFEFTDGVHNLILGILSVRAEVVRLD